MASWAKYCENQAGIRVQLRLQAGYGGLDKIIFTTAKENDNKYFLTLLDLKQDAGAIYLFDDGYYKISTYDKITDSGNFFVTTLHGSISYEIIEEKPLPQKLRSVDTLYNGT